MFWSVVEAAPQGAAKDHCCECYYGDIRRPSEFDRNDKIVEIVHLNYIYIYIYIYILYMAICGDILLYIAIYAYRSGGHSLICPFSVSVALHLPMLEYSALTPSIVDDSFGIGLMNMFLMTVGLFLFSVNSWIWRCFYKSNQGFLRTHRFPCWLSICKSASSFVVEKALIRLEMFLFVEKGVYVVRRRALICLRFSL